MIKKETSVIVIDNSGGQIARCICVYKSAKYAKIGDIILVTVRKTSSTGKVNKIGVMYKAMIVRTKYPFRKSDGTIIRFRQNAVVLLNEDLKPIGNKAEGVILKEVADKGVINIAKKTL